MKIASSANHDALIAAARRQVTAVLGDSDASSAGIVRTSGLPPDPPGYRMERPIHRGAQGVVYLAVQQSTGRKVAVKIMRDRSFASPRDRARFEREIHILSQLDHPGIVRIIDSGEADGRHYFVMDYVDGVPLDGFGSNETDGETQRRRDEVGASEVTSSLPLSVSPFLSPKNKLRLFAGVCDAVHAAHLRGVIHRDLKPGNILVDADGNPHVLDFGLAKLFAPDEGADTEARGMTAMTETGQFLGSLPWASPEQVAGTPTAIDIRSDVYSLGVILYQMLTAEFPYRVSGSIREVTDNILSADPARPSTFAREIDEEVETIILKTLNKEPQRRYQSAGDLARDIRHYLAGEMIEAKHDSLPYVLRKQFRRHWLALSVAAGFALVVTAGLIVALTFWGAAVHQRDQHEAQRRRAESIATVLHNMLASASPAVAQGEDMTVAQVLDAAAAEIDAGSLRDHADVEASIRRTLGDTYLALGKLARAEDHLRSALAIDDRIYGRQHSESALCLAGLARVHDHLANREQAITEFQEALAILRATGEEARPEALAIMMSLATTFGALERSDEAQAIQEQALDLSRANYGEDHPETARIRIAIATRRNGGKRSLELLREELALNQATLGVRHPRTLDTQRHLADELHLHGHVEQAERAYLEALGIARGIYGDNHPNVIRLVLNLNWLYQHTQQSTKTGPLLREFEPAARATFGPQSIRYAEYLTVLGTAMLLNEHNDAGAGLLQQALDTLSALGREQGWQGAEPRIQLAIHAESRGAYEEVERLSREILAIDEDSNGDRMASRRAIAKSLLGNVLAQRCEFAAAETLLLEGYEGLAERKSLLPFQRRAIERLISLYETWDAAEPDAGHARHAEEWHDMLKDNT